MGKLAHGELVARSLADGVGPGVDGRHVAAAGAGKDHLRECRARCRQGGRDEN